MVTSYHNHSRWSDGASAIADVVAAASAANIDDVGFSDHLTLDPWGEPPAWAMDPARLDEYAAEVRSAAQPGARVLLGIEADFFPETQRRLAGVLERHPFDFVIGAVHFLDRLALDGTAPGWEKLSPDARELGWRRYWASVAAMARTRLFDIAAHLDLPKRLGLPPRDPLPDGALRALDAIAAAGMAIELNTAGWFAPVGECYPSSALLAEAKRREIPLTITTDAHRPDDVGRALDRGRDVARAAGYREIAIFEQRRRRLVAV